MLHVRVRVRVLLEKLTFSNKRNITEPRDLILKFIFNIKLHGIVFNQTSSNDCDVFGGAIILILI